MQNSIFQIKNNMITYDSFLTCDLILTSESTFVRLKFIILFSFSKMNRNDVKVYYWCGILVYCMLLYVELCLYSNKHRYVETVLKWSNFKEMIKIELFSPWKIVLLIFKEELIHYIFKKSNGRQKQPVNQIALENYNAVTIFWKVILSQQKVT